MISLNQAKWHLRIVDDHDDAEIQIKLTMAQDIVMQHIGCLRTENPDADVARLRQDVIRAAILLVLGELWANREASTANPLSPSIRSLLEVMREPGLA